MLFFVAAALVLSEEAKHTLAITTPPMRDGKVVSLMLVNTVGLDASVTAARGGDADDRLGSLALATRRMGFAYDRGLDVRLVTTLELGASEHARAVTFHGGGTAEVAGGYRFHVTDTQGPFVRGGAMGVLAGDALVYQSLFEVPQLQLGYQYIAGTTLLEVAERTGLGLFGRSDTGDHASRHLDRVIDVGAMATVRKGPVLALAGWSHFLADGTGTPVDWLSVSLCVIARTLAVCTEARAVLGDVFLATGGPVSSSVSTLGLTVGASR